MWVPALQGIESIPLRKSAVETLSVRYQDSALPDDEVQKIDALDKQVCDLNDIVPGEGAKKRFHSERGRNQAVRCHHEIDLSQALFTKPQDPQIAVVVRRRVGRPNETVAWVDMRGCDREATVIDGQSDQYLLIAAMVAV